MAATQPQSVLRLTVQAAVEIPDDAAGRLLYAHLKGWLGREAKIITINAQIVQQLEPCCNQRKETANVQNPQIPP